MVEAKDEWDYGSEEAPWEPDDDWNIEEPELLKKASSMVGNDGVY